MIKNICVVYTHHKLGDLIWQLPYIKAISDHHKLEIDLIVREKTQAKNIFRDLKYIKSINYNNFRKGIFYWVDVFKLMKIFFHNKYSHVYILDKVNKPAIAAKLCGVKNIISNSGTAITERQINLIWRYFQSPIICLDGDDSGQQAASRISEKLFPLITECAPIAVSQSPSKTFKIFLSECALL